MWFSSFLNSIFFFPGALFTEDQRGSPSELAFKYSIYRINKDKDLLANSTLVYDIQYVPKDDSFHAAKKGKLLTTLVFFNIIFHQIIKIKIFNHSNYKEKTIVYYLLWNGNLLF